MAAQYPDVLAKIDGDTVAAQAAAAALLVAQQAQAAANASVAADTALVADDLKRNGPYIDTRNAPVILSSADGQTITTTPARSGVVTIPDAAPAPAAAAG